VVKISIGGIEKEINQSGLRKWLTLEDIKESVFEAVEHKDRDELTSALYLYVSTAFDINKDVLDKAFWMEIIIAFKEQETSNKIDVSNLACMQIKAEKKPDKMAWEYIGQTWWKWVDAFSSRYGWSLDAIENLKVIDATHLIQEIFVNEQLTKEWQWLLSERCFIYDEASKKSKFNELKRPKWMSKQVTTQHADAQMKIPISMLPVGNIIHGTNKPK
jgi:hypothetical protein